MAKGVYLEIDASEYNALIERVRTVMTPAQINQMMYGVLRRAEGHIRARLPKDVVPVYQVKSQEVKKAVGHAKMTGGSLGGVGCIIPVSGPRRSIGGSFKASGGARGWESLRKKYRVKARIVKAGQSTLPPKMDSYGGMPPFRNLSAKKLNGVTFTREGKSRFPIMKVEGISIAQMPANRAKPALEKDIREYLYKRVEHEVQRRLQG